MATISQADVDLVDVVPLHRFSTADYLGMIDKGVLGPDNHVELIGGVIVEMSPAGIPHNHYLIRIVRLFAPLLARFEFAIQGTLTVAEGHVFDPDFMLLRQRPDGYKTKLPDASDVQLVIEAVESSLRKDQQIKAPAYAAARIPEYWIADLDREQLLIHRQPEGGAYKAVETRRGDDLISPLAAPEFSFAVRRVFD
ncbi:MAG TPA: Uma2 family endonuclease [Lacipirellulaceae bacterium]|nr:Uma2 family endonuclease [Lacipirellulaceae bacterium]